MIALADFHPIPQAGDVVGALPSRWTPDHAARRMIEAFETAMLMGGRHGPRDARGFWPETFHTQVDLAWQRELTDAEIRDRQKQQNHVRPQPTSAQIANLDRVNGWMLDFCHAGKSVQVLTAYAWHCVKGRESRWWPEAEFAEFASFLDERGEAVV